MDQLAAEFDRGRRSLARRQGIGRGKRYPAALRSIAFQFCAEALSAGWSLHRVAKRLGVSKATLARWCDAEAPVQTAPMREVVISDRRSELEMDRPVVVTPEGFRIEGLRGEALIETLKALRG